MNDLELKKFIEDNRCNFTRLLRTHYTSIYEEIDLHYTGKEFTEKLYKHLNRHDDLVGKCIVCSSDCGFLDITRGFNKTCNIKCRDIVRYKNVRVTRNCKICNKEFQVYKKSKTNFCSNECRIVQNKLNATERVKKSYESNVRNHGGVHSASLPEHKIKSKATILKKYGSENYRNIEKSKQTRLERYGNENYTNPEKVKETCLARYGVKNIFLHKKANGIGISKPQRKLFEMIKEKYPDSILEYQIPELNISADIYIPEKNLIIEFFGDYWHCNPSKYTEDYYHRYIHLSAADIWKKDKIREDSIKQLGYNFQIVWESDFNSVDYIFPGA
jgi:endogenous inhibitor of DNA gyrase (YacG/DUF329 family)